MPASEERNLCAFGITHRECYFCGQPRTIRFNEHYTFCPNCSAIYTTMIIQESKCEHIKYGIPEAIRVPWYASARLAKIYIRSDDGDDQFCSICGSNCIADGW